MKARKSLGILLCSAVILLLAPVSIHAETYTYNYTYDGLTISSDTLAPQYISYIAGMISIKPMSNPNEYHFLVISGTTTSDSVTILADIDTHATIRLHNVTMIGKYCAFIVSKRADVGLQLAGVNTLISTGNYPAISVNEENAILSIWPWEGASYLYAKGGPVNPGIKVGRTTWDPVSDHATLNINGGTVVAVSGAEGGGGTGSAGIGGENHQSGGEINISGGFVVAVGDKAAGIGSGNDSEKQTKIGGEINISGGTVIAVGGNEGAGIGGGDDDSDGGKINISGGFVTAVGGSYSAGIGGGNNGTSGEITITGGTVIATGGYGGAGIGGGKHNNEDGGFVNSIQIHDGVIFASGNNGGEDIGFGDLREGTPVDFENMTGAVAIHADVVNDSNPTAVFLRNNRLFGENYGKHYSWLAPEEYSRIGSMGYEDISKYGIDISSLIPAPGDIPAITGTLPDGGELSADWIKNLWENQLDHWEGAQQAGACLLLKSVYYHCAGMDTIAQSQHKGTSGEIRGGDIFDRPGYSFITWRTSPEGGEPYPPGTIYTFSNDLHLYATWNIFWYDITYHLGDGEVFPPNPAKYTVNMSFKLNNPVKDGYVFAGWSGTGIAGMSTEVTVPAGSTGDRAYTANWTDVRYTVSYDLAGGAVSASNPEEYTVESGAFTLVNPTREGYVFAGWSGTGITGMSTDVTVPAGSTGDRAYTANWTAVRYTVSYDLAGGAVSASNPGEYTVESGAFTLVNPTREGYVFAGWSGTGITGMSTDVMVPGGSTGDRAYTANWTAVRYTISYDLAGGAVSVSNPEEYTIESGAFTLVNPTREGYVFAGWSGTGITGMSTDVTVPGGSTGDRAYTANWTADNAPDTGERSQPFLWLLCGALAAVAAGTVLYKRKRA